MAALFFALSLAPSLLPRTGVFQGVVSGVTTIIGYGFGVFGAWLWCYLGVPVPSRGTRPWKFLIWVPVAAVAVITVLAVWRQVGWQNDVRERFGMPSISPAVWLPIVPVTLLVALLLLITGRAIRR